MKKSLVTIVGALWFIFGFIVVAHAEFPKSGTFTYHHSYRGTFTEMVMGETNYNVWNVVGPAITVKGIGYVTTDSEQCIGYTLNDVYSGFCTAVDGDGDKVFSEIFEGVNSTGVEKGKITGGTGKFAGITGTFTAQQLGLFPAPEGDGTLQGVAAVTVTYKIP